MRQAWLSLLLILLIPVYLLVLIFIHELGHTLLARLLGDPNAVFYLYRAEEHSRCLGCTLYDISKLSWGSHLIVSIGGLFATQTIALLTLVFLRFRQFESRLPQTIFSMIAVTFVFFDVPLQMIQSLTSDLERSTWPTGMDLVDLMLLLQQRLHFNPLLLKGAFLSVSLVYLAVFLWSYQRTRMASKLLKPDPYDL